MTTSTPKKGKGGFKTSPVPKNTNAETGLPRDLHAASDELNTALLDFERALASLNLGISASVLLSSEYSVEGDFIETFLAFRKVGRQWVLLTEVGPSGGHPDEWSETPLVHTSRETRLCAVDKLEELHKKLLQEYHAECQRTLTSVDYVKRLTKKISGVEGADNGG